MNFPIIKELFKHIEVPTLPVISCDQQDEFTMKLMKSIVTQAWVSRQYGRHQPGRHCSCCWAWLVYKVKNPKTGLKTNRSFKNQHEAMMKGKHRPNCMFINALAVMSNYGELT